MFDEPPLSQTGRYFEDIEVGQRYTSPRVTLTEEAIIRFALEWDPESFHIDREGAKSSIFGQLVGSGLQTLLLTSRMIYDSGVFRGTALTGLAMGDMKYMKPILPGDTIGAVFEIIEKKETSKQARGRIRLGIDTVNQRHETILSHTRDFLVACRPANNSGPDNKPLS